MPEPGSEAEKLYKKSQEILDGWKKDHTHGFEDDKKRVKRQNLPATDYVVQIYMIVDYYLYETYVQLQCNSIAGLQRQHNRLEDNAHFGVTLKCHACIECV